MSDFRRSTGKTAPKPPSRKTEFRMTIQPFASSGLSADDLQATVTNKVMDTGESTPISTIRLLPSSSALNH
jgi:hypothetical protein